MIKIFTQHDLIRYIYQETTEEEAREINGALLCDSELLAMFNELKTLKKQLGNALMEPSAKTINNILDYARGINAKG